MPLRRPGMTTPKQEQSEMRKTFMRWLVPALLAPCVELAQAQAPVVVDTAFVEQAAERGAILLDVRSEEEFKRGHLPGALSFEEPQGRLSDAKTEDYLPIPQIERILGEAGIDPAREIVAYGAKGMPPAYFAYQTLIWLGASRVHVYHGGFDDWKAAGKPVSTDRTPVQPVKFEAESVRKDRMVSTEQVVAKLNRPDVQIVDARTSREFAGDDIRALRGGHIPGAVNIPYEQNWADPDTPRKLQRRQVLNKDGMALKSRDALKELYAALDPEKETIVYCQSGSRAAETAAVLQDLGFKNIKLYDSSWLVYGNTFDAPAESVSYFNVSRVNSLLNQLQGRVDALEAELEQMKAAAARKQ
jgi:thiosulfate/3-mercaptopyruvate sulfurtransferase